VTTPLSTVDVTITVNGARSSHEIEPRLLLVHLLRDRLHLTGTHVGCDTSNCGACTVLLGDDAVKSCTVLAVQADGEAVTTIEGIGGPDGKLSPMQEGFRQQHGLQCGYCTPGMVIAAIGLLGQNPDPSPTEIREALEGNLCRCTGYDMIVRSIRWAVEHPDGVPDDVTAMEPAP
jgi:carbon-monoxide dehydrogenase small subunit